jgi:long-subunit fatty acid transport protein
MAAFVVGDPIRRPRASSAGADLNNPFTCLDVPPRSVRSPRSPVPPAHVRRRGRVEVLSEAFHRREPFAHQRFLGAAFTSRYTQQLDPKQVLVQATAKAKGGEVELSEVSDTTFGFGFKWSPTDKISVGGVYKEGPEFETSLFYADSASQFNFSERARPNFHIPDIAGLGVSVRPTQVLTINVDAVHVKYSNLADDHQTVYASVATLEKPFSVDDVIELRAGAEYFFATKIPFALRAGYWRDPAHSIEWNGPLTHPDFIAEAMLFPEGEDQNHFSVGAGLAWPRFQIDAAYDTSKHYKVGSISVVTRF